MERSVDVDPWIGDNVLGRSDLCTKRKRNFVSE